MREKLKLKKKKQVAAENSWKLARIYNRIRND